MKHTDIKALFENSESFIGKTVTVCGWVRTSAEVKPMTFIQINDGTTTTRNLQLTIHSDEFSEEKYLSEVKPLLTLGVSLKATGTIVASERNIIELETSDLQLLGGCPEDYPLQKKRSSAEFLRTIPHLRTRTNMMKACMTIRSTLAYAVHDYFHNRGYAYIHTPIITSSDCEGAGEMFRVTTQPWNTDYKSEQEYYENDYFGCKAGLTVSCQLEGEMAAMAMGKIYTFGPSFRAENSNTPKHLAEFWHVEPEIAFAELPEVIETAEDMIKHVIRTLLDTCPNEMKFFDEHFEKGLIDRLEELISHDFGVVTYTEAIKLLKESGENFVYPVEWGCDLQTEHERYISEKVFKKAVFVTDYPKEIKSFYMKQNPDGKTVAAVDLLVPGVGEIIGGSEREADYDKLVATMKERGMNLDLYSDYLDLRKYGSVPHGGFGLGFERLIMYVTGMQNIRDVILFPRTVGSIR